MKSSIVGVGRSRIGKLNTLDVLSLLEEALVNALDNAGLDVSEIDALILCPALADQRIMPAHNLAYRLGISDNLVLCMTTDVGGAGPVSALILADNLIKSKRVKTVAVIAGDAVYSLGTSELLRRASMSISHPEYKDVTYPLIPLLYNMVAEWHMEKYGTAREQLAMVPALMSRQAALHPDAMNRKVLTVEDVLASPRVESVTNRLECARPTDGAGAVILVSGRQAKNFQHKSISIEGSGEGAGPPYTPKNVSEDMFSAGRAAKAALKEAGISDVQEEIDFWGIYDCFPVCFIKFAESVGLVQEGLGGPWVESLYKHTDPVKDRLNINTHGGLLSFGAPWEAPAIFSVIEAVEQMRGHAEERQLSKVSTALIYGNGGIFTSSAVVVLAL